MHSTFLDIPVSELPGLEAAAVASDDNYMHFIFVGNGRPTPQECFREKERES